jgi:hypothetical protein
MLTDKQLKSILSRIKRHNAGLSCLGAMMLEIQIQAMTEEQRAQLDAFLASKGVVRKGVVRK